MWHSQQPTLPMTNEACSLSPGGLFFSLRPGVEYRLCLRSPSAKNLAANVFQSGQQMNLGRQKEMLSGARQEVRRTRIDSIYLD